jgi:PhnB protein
MSSRLNPYLSFANNARDALTFYQQVFGGELSMNTFGELGDSNPEIADLVMHGQLETSDGFTLMASDTPPGMEFNPGNTMTVSLSGDDTAKLRSWWDQLADGGQVGVPLEQQMWGDTFGMVIDRFGTPWMVNIAGTAT